MARSRNHSYSGNAAMYCAFPHYLTNGTILGRWVRGGGELLNIKYVFCFSLQLLSVTFLILRRIQRDIIINVYRPSLRTKNYGESPIRSQQKIREKEENGIGLDTHYVKKREQQRKLH